MSKYNMIKGKIITVKFHDKTYNEITAEAQRRSCSKSAVIRSIIEPWIRNKKQLQEARERK